MNSVVCENFIIILIPNFIYIHCLNFPYFWLQPLHFEYIYMYDVVHNITVWLWSRCNNFHSPVYIFNSAYWYLCIFHLNYLFDFHPSLLDFQCIDRSLNFLMTSKSLIYYLLNLVLVCLVLWWISVEFSSSFLFHHIFTLVQLLAVVTDLHVCTLIICSLYFPITISVFPTFIKKLHLPFFWVYSVGRGQWYPTTQLPGTWIL